MCAAFPEEEMEEDPGDPIARAALYYACPPRPSTNRPDANVDRSRQAPPPALVTKGTVLRSSTAATVGDSPCVVRPLTTKGHAAAKALDSAEQETTAAAVAQPPEEEPDPEEERLAGLLRGAPSSRSAPMAPG